MKANIASSIEALEPRIAPAHISLVHLVAPITTAPVVSGDHSALDAVVQKAVSSTAIAVGKLAALVPVEDIETIAIGAGIVGTDAQMAPSIGGGDSTASTPLATAIDATPSNADFGVPNLALIRTSGTGDLASAISGIASITGAIQLSGTAELASIADEFGIVGAMPAGGVAGLAM